MFGRHFDAEMPMADGMGVYSGPILGVGVNQNFKLGPWVVQPSLNSVSRNGHAIHLEPKAMEVLVRLAQQDGNVVSKEKLIGDVWADTFVGDDALIRCISDLRRALEDDPKSPRVIETIPKRGYRLLVRTQSLNNIRDHTGLHVRWRAVPVLLAIGTVALAYWFHARRVPPITERDSVVVADFVNTTGDPVFDDTLKQGLSVQLSQSPFLNLLPDQRVRETLKLMGRAPEDQLTPDVAREICVRSSSKVMLTGSISRLGNQYVIGLKAVNCNSGEIFAQEQVQVAAKEEVLKALGQQTTILRQKLGESISSIRKFDVPFDQVTTPSLDALKAWSGADIARSVKGERAAIPFLRRAVELDPTSLWRTPIWPRCIKTSKKTRCRRRA